MGQGRERQVDRSALERVAHQRDRRHRLEVRAGQPHALGAAGRATGADDRGEVVAGWSVDRADGVTGRQEVLPPQRPGQVGVAVQADQRGRPGRSSLDRVRPAARRLPGRPAAGSRRARAARGSRPASLRGLSGHHTAPARLMPSSAVKATGSLAERIATVSPGAMPCAASAAEMRKRQLPHLGVGAGDPVGGQAGGVGRHRRTPCRGSRPAARRISPRPSGPARRPGRTTAARRAARGGRRPGSPTRNRPAAAAAGAARRPRRPAAGRSACSSGCRG